MENHPILRSSAPGSLFLFGEYGVLHGEPAILSAVAPVYVVELIERKDDKLVISSQLGNYETSIHAMHPVAPFEYVLAACQSREQQIKNGLTLRIHSAQSDSIGLGSSGAVLVATLKILECWLGQERDLEALFFEGLKLMRTLNDQGSGADIAASVFGGTILYQQGEVPEKIASRVPLSFLYSGQKVKTSVCLEIVRALEERHPAQVGQIYRLIGSIAREAQGYIEKEDWLKLGSLMAIAQGQFEALGVSTERLRSMVELCLAEPSIHGAKISGAGLGDGVIALGEVRIRIPRELSDSGLKQIEITPSENGVRCERLEAGIAL